MKYKCLRSTGHTRGAFLQQNPALQCKCAKIMSAWGWHRFHFYSTSQSKSSQELPRGSDLTSSIRLSQIRLCLYCFHATFHTCTHMHTTRSSNRRLRALMKGTAGYCPSACCRTNTKYCWVQFSPGISTHTHSSGLRVKTYLIAFPPFFLLMTANETQYKTH